MSKCEVCGKEPEELDEPCEECGLDYIPVESAEQTDTVQPLTYDDNTHRISEGLVEED